MTERDSKGRFVKGNGAAKGNKGGPGRPPKAREERYYEITVSTVTYNQWERIVRKAAQQAERGDATARKWLADYLVGTPEQNLNLGGGLTHRIVFAWDHDTGDEDQSAGTAHGETTPDDHLSG